MTSAFTLFDDNIISNIVSHLPSRSADVLLNTITDDQYNMFECPLCERLCTPNQNITCSCDICNLQVCKHCTSKCLCYHPTCTNMVCNICYNSPDTNFQEHHVSMCVICRQIGYYYPKCGSCNKYHCTSCYHCQICYVVHCPSCNNSDSQYGAGTTFCNSCI